MSLIAKNKIAEYIDKHPEARISLSTWLKEYPYREGKNLFYTQDGNSLQGMGGGQSQPGIGDYIINYKINNSAKAVLIAWVGNIEEHVVEKDRAFKEMQEKYPNLIRESVKIKEVVLISPPLRKTKKQSEDKITGTNSNTAILLADANNKIASVNLSENLEDREGFSTEADYRSALARIIVIFDSQPGTAEFDELLALLPLIENYEDYKLKIPAVEAFEIIKSKMDMTSLPPDYLAAIVGSKDKVTQFLLGKLELSSKKMERIYKRLHINLPVIPALKNPAEHF